MIRALESGFTFEAQQPVDDGHTCVRLVTGWNSTAEDVDALLARLLVLGGNRNAFHDDLAGLRGSNQNLAFLALVLTGDHNHRILGTDMHILLPLLTELREPETRSS